MSSEDEFPESLTSLKHYCNCPKYLNISTFYHTNFDQMRMYQSAGWMANQQAQMKLHMSGAVWSGMPCFLMHICPKINRVSGIHCAFARCTRLHIIFYKNVILIYFTLPWMGTTDNFDIVLHFHSSSTVLPELVKLRQLQSLMPFSHLFFCLPLLLFSWNVPCRIVFAMPEEREIWPPAVSFLDYCEESWTSFGSSPDVLNSLRFKYQQRCLLSLTCCPTEGVVLVNPGDGRSYMECLLILVISNCPV